MTLDIKMILEEKRFGWIAGCSLGNWIVFQARNPWRYAHLVLMISYICQNYTLLCLFQILLIINTAANKSREGATLNEVWYCTSIYCISVYSGWGLWMSNIVCTEWLQWAASKSCLTLSSIGAINTYLMAKLCVSAHKILHLNKKLIKCSYK